jgi:cation transport ATPase
MNYSPISSLSLINHVLVDKTGTLTIPSFKIKWIFIFDSLYKLRYRVFAEKEF